MTSGWVDNCLEDGPRDGARDGQDGGDAGDEQDGGVVGHGRWTSWRGEIVAFAAQKMMLAGVHHQKVHHAPARVSGADQCRPFATIPAVLQPGAGPMQLQLGEGARYQAVTSSVVRSGLKPPGGAEIVGKWPTARPMWQVWWRPPSCS